MSKCIDCGKPFDELKERRFKCFSVQCGIWTHKNCSDKRQITTEGFWYCKDHIRDVSAELLRNEIISSNEEEEFDNANGDLNQIIEQNNSNNEPLDPRDEIPNRPLPPNNNDVILVETHDNVNNPSVRSKRANVNPYDDGNEMNPFANFDCDICKAGFTSSARGVFCLNCRNTFHISCLTAIELEGARKSKFVCQDCIQDEIRRNNLKERQRKEMKSQQVEKSNEQQQKHDKPNIASTPKDFHKSTKKSKNKKSHAILSSDSDSFAESIESSDEDRQQTKILTRDKKSKNSHKNRKSHIGSESSSDSSDRDNNIEITQADAMISLYKLTQEEREKSKYENLPIVDSADTKWSVFYELFKESRKLFSDSHNILRIQKAIKCKEILDIGGINLFDPRTYWSTIKLINKRLCRSFNLLQRETNEIIKLKKMRNDYDSKKIIEFINKIVNYNCIVDKYGTKKHRVDERVISHIGNIMPYNMMNGWHKMKAKLEENDNTVYLKHIAEYLSKQVAYLNSKMQSEELDPWKESNSSKSFKKPEFNGKRNYNVVAKPIYNTAISQSFNNYCWYHKNQNHSAFKCFKLWELSGKEVSDLARKNDVCTFCGNKRQKGCHENRNLLCKLENCNLKHHMLFCFRRKGKNESRNYNNRHDDSNETNNNNNMRKNYHNNRNANTKNNNGSERSCKKIEMNNSLRKEAEMNNNIAIQCAEDEIEVPQSNFYFNNPPKTLKVNSNNYHEFSSWTRINNNHMRAEINYSNKHKTRRTSSCLLGVVVIKFLDSNENVAILIDSGSSASVIEEKFANKLELMGYWDPLRMNWSSDMNRVDFGSRIVNVRASTTAPNASEFNIGFRTVKDLNMHDQYFDAEEMYELYPYLRHLHLTSYSKIQGIVGYDNSWVFHPSTAYKPRNWSPSMPYGIRSPLGDYVVGNRNQIIDIYNYLRDRNNNNNCHNVGHSAFCNKITLSRDEELELAEIESRLVGQDYRTFCAGDSESYEDSLALDILNKYVKRCENGINFEAPLLWRDENVKLPTEQSFKIALRRLIIVEKNSIKNGRFDECVEQVENLLNKNYAEIVPSNEINVNNNKIFYIPTFFIQPKNKRTRFIWDAATKVEGKSLNDYLLAGPNLYNNYLDIIFQMQEGKYLLKGDLQEMFHQVWMRQEDRDSLRFLFRKSPDEKLQILRMRVMIFGSKCSPTTSQYVKNKIAHEFVNSHPEAADVILHSTYVDDVITSVDNLDVGQSLVLDIRNILKTGGFNLVKLKSNNDQILDKVRNHLTSDDMKNEKLFSNEVEEKLLGYLINFADDEIKIALTLEKIPENIMNCIDKPNKKQVLQLCMSIFDPVGYIEFLLSKFKLIYHWLIKEKYEWNQIMDDKYFPIWKKCVSWLKEIQNIKIPRIYSHLLLNADKIQLIGFGDAGTEILCAVIYMRLLDENRNQIDYRFVHANSYIVPIKQSRTIPELELDIACKLAILMSKVQKAHKRIKFDEIIYFTDNIAVKEWICHGAKNPKVYVKNRLSKLQQLTKVDEWNWIPTNLQPADFGTKISSMPEITYLNEWFHPSLFKMPEDNWPKLEANSESTHTVNNMVSGEIDDFDYSDPKFVRIETFSSYDRLMKAIMRAVEIKVRVKLVILNNKLAELKPEEGRTRSETEKIKHEIQIIKEAKIEYLNKIIKLRDNYSFYELCIIRSVQKEAFGVEYETILNNKPLKRTNVLYKLLPYIDNDGIMRIQSRITDNEANREKFGFDRINPIILPRDHALTKLIILKYHNSQAHHNEKTVIVNLLQKFHISKMKRTVNMVIKKNCMRCRISHAKPDIPLMGDIPSHRLAFHLPAFTYVIADLLGPITVKASKFTINKRYVLVYSCLTTRALHLELIESLESNATLRAFQNTFNLRGVPRRICSDNGTNFVGGNNIMQKCHSQWNEQLIERGVIFEPIEWYFSPPRTPHMNGSVERMVGLVKKALKQIQTYMDTKHSHYDDFGLKTVLCEIINMINSRPLEIYPSEDNQHEFLTPNYFIMGRQNAQSVPPESKLPRTFTQQWNDIKMITNIIWEKWLKSYFPLLMQREKWIERSKPLEIGDIVLTADPSIANSWRMGKIINVVKGSQSQVRQVLIKLGKNKAINKSKIKNYNQLNKSYLDEAETIVSRPAIAVARLNLSPIN